VTYADLVEHLSHDTLARLAAARGDAPPPAFASLYRPLGAALLLRLAREPALDLDTVDPLSVGVAHAMLEQWIAASVGDPTPLPIECDALPAADAARAALASFLVKHWPPAR
jgi:hypothetical protein